MAAPASLPGFGDAHSPLTQIRSPLQSASLVQPDGGGFPEQAAAKVATATAIQRAEISASQQLTAAGQRVCYLRSMFIIGEARCMCLFEADDEAAVAAVNQVARLPFSRIVEALDLTP